MKHQLLFLLIVISSINSYAQVTFESGYFIDNTNKRTDCLIKNIDWQNNPSEFEYKLMESAQPKTITIQTVQEFGIINISKYIRSTVQIDRSSENINNLSNSETPEFVEQKIFLKLLVEGKANLYSYEEKGLKRYFFNVDESEIRQLIFKTYKSSEYNIAKNNRFKQQLWEELKCPSLTMTKIRKIDYHKNDLVDFFEAYNTCNGGESVNYDEKQNRDFFNLTIRPGLNLSSLSIANDFNGFGTSDTNFDTEIGFRIGIEAELVLPFNKNKWSIILEPTYQKYKSTKITDAPNVTGDKLIASADYSSIELPLGIRHYFFLNNDSKIFINMAYVLDFSSNTTIQFERADGSPLNTLDVNSRDNLAFGLGYKFKNKYVLEFRYQSDREILGDYVNWNSKYNSISIIFGYSLF